MARIIVFAIYRLFLLIGDFSTALITFATVETTGEQVGMTIIFPLIFLRVQFKMRDFFYYRQ